MTSLNSRWQHSGFTNLKWFNEKKDKVPSYKRERARAQVPNLVPKAKCYSSVKQSSRSRSLGVKRS